MWGWVFYPEGNSFRRCKGIEAHSFPHRSRYEPRRRKLIRRLLHLRHLALHTPSSAAKSEQKVQTCGEKNKGGSEVSLECIKNQTSSCCDWANETCFFGFHKVNRNSDLKLCTVDSLYGRSSGCRCRASKHASLKTHQRPKYASMEFFQRPRYAAFLEESWSLKPCLRYRNTSLKT